MGRQPNVPQVTPNGTYRCWHPSIKKYVNLGTTDYQAACALQAGFYGRNPHQGVSRPAPTPNPPTVGNPTFPYPARQTGSADVIDFDKESDPLSGWLNKDKPNEPATTAPPSVFQPPWVQPTSNQQNPANGTVAGGKGLQKPKPGLTPEQSAKLASGLKKTVANLNVIIVGAGVQMFGRVPAPLDDEEVQLLQMGWEMYIDEMFAKAKIKPWHLLLAGNVMIAAAMYVGGTPIPKKALPPNDPSKAKSATVTPIDGGKPNG